jgi:hypothetical protein
VVCGPGRDVQGDVHMHYLGIYAFSNSLNQTRKMYKNKSMFRTIATVVDSGLIKDFNYMKNMLPSCPVLSINIFFTEILNTVHHLTKKLLSWNVHIYQNSRRHIQVDSNLHETKNRI